MLSMISETEYVIDYVRKPKIIIGDFNAKIRRKIGHISFIGKHSLHSESNKNFNKLVMFAAAWSIIVCS